MRSRLLLQFVLWMFAGCATPPSGRNLASVSWHNPGPQRLQNASVLLGGQTRPVLVDEVPPYTETPASAGIPLPTRPIATLHYQVNGKSVHQRFPVERPLRNDAAGNYNLRIHVVGWDVIGVELEPASVAAKRLGNTQQPPTP